MTTVNQHHEFTGTERSSTILVLTALTALVLGAIGATLFQGYILDARKDELTVAVEKRADYIGAYAERMEKKATELALNGETFFELIKRHADHDYDYDPIIAGFLTRSFEAFPDAIGGGIWYEPYRFDTKRRYYGPYAYRKGERVEFTWDLSSPSYDYFKWDWYTMAIPADWDRAQPRPREYYWSAPYTDGAGSGARMVTVDAFMHDHASGEIIGISTVDWAVDSMLDLLEGQRISPRSHSFLLDRKSGLLLSFTLDPTMHMKHRSELPWLASLAEPPTGRPTVLPVEIGGEAYSIFHVTTRNDMIYGVMVPNADISGSIGMLLLFGGVVAMVLVLVSLGIYKMVVDRLHQTVAARTEELWVAKEAAEASARAKSRFLANMSHEIRTPLNGVVGFTNLLAKTRLDATQSEYLHTIRHSLDALLTIINDILDFSRIESGKLLIHNQRFDLHTVVTDTLRLFTTTAATKELTLELDFQLPAPYQVAGDPVRIAQLLGNLLSNAVKFTEEGGVTLRVTSVEEEGTSLVHFEVIDSGRGIDPAMAHYLFDAFEQAHSDDTRTGTGLGLTITKSLVEAMQGTMGFATLERGTRFWVKLPLVRCDTTEPGDGACAPSSFDRLRGKHVLVVDDVAINRKLITTILRQWNITYAEANDGAEAIARSEDERFDLILMDIRMPVMDGLMATRTIRQQEGESAHTPIIGLTAHAFPHEQEEFLKAGMDTSLTKPVSEEQLINVMMEFLG